VIFRNIQRKNRVQGSVHVQKQKSISVLELFYEYNFSITKTMTNFEVYMLTKRQARMSSTSKTPKNHSLI